MGDGESRLTLLGSQRGLTGGRRAAVMRGSPLDPVPFVSERPPTP